MGGRMSDQESRPGKFLSFGIVFGAGAGVPLGLVMRTVFNHNGLFALGIAIGLALGICLSVALAARGKS